MKQILQTTLLVAYVLLLMLLALAYLPTQFIVVFFYSFVTAVVLSFTKGFLVDKGWL